MIHKANHTKQRLVSVHRTTQFGVVCVHPTQKNNPGAGWWSMSTCLMILAETRSPKVEIDLPNPINTLEGLNGACGERVQRSADWESEGAHRRWENLAPTKQLYMWLLKVPQKWLQYIYIYTHTLFIPSYSYRVMSYFHLLSKVLWRVQVVLLE